MACLTWFNLIQVRDAILPYAKGQMKLHPHQRALRMAKGGKLSFAHNWKWQGVAPSGGGFT